MHTQPTLEENSTDDDRPTCPNGSEFCSEAPGDAADDDLPCWLCYDTTGLAEEETVTPVLSESERWELATDGNDDPEVVTDGGTTAEGATAGAGGADLTDREVRGLTELLVVLEEAPGMATVFSEDGTPRTVDYEDGACDCPDRQYNDPDGPCKHEAAAVFLVGDREIPEWVDRDEINAQVAQRAGE